MPSLLPALSALRRLRCRISGRTSPVSRPLRAHERSWRASRHLPVLAAVFRIALRSRPTAPLVTARVPLREAIAVFGPVFRPCPSLGRSPGSAPGPALLQGRWARLRSSLRVFSHTGFRWLTVTISPNLVRVERVIRFSGEKFHRFKTGCGIVALARKSDCNAIARARPRAGRRMAAGDNQCAVFPASNPSPPTPLPLNGERGKLGRLPVPKQI